MRDEAMEVYVAAILVVAVTVVFPACGKATQAADSTACVERLVVPRYPPIASSARAAVDNLVASVRLAADASIETISVSVPAGQEKQAKLIVPTVEASLRESAFRGDCRGKEVAFRFDFRLSERREDDGRVMFHAPNRFEVFDSQPVINFQSQ